MLCELAHRYTAQANLTRFPCFAHARGVEIVVEGGDMLFLPAGWWHQVASEGGRSLGVNMWFSKDIEDAGFGVTTALGRTYGMSDGTESRGVR